MLMTALKSKVVSWFREPATKHENLKILYLAAYGEALLYLVNLYLDLISHLGFRYEDYKPFNSGNAIAFTSNVLDFDIVLFADFNRGGLSHRGLARFKSHNNHLPYEERKFRPYGLLRSVARLYQPGS
jgi:hypothetical protein